MHYSAILSLFALSTLASASAASGPQSPASHGVLAKRTDCSWLASLLGQCSTTPVTPNYLIDPLNCGGPGVVCKSIWPGGLGGLGAVCVLGKCGASSCKGTLFDFNFLTGQCQDVSSDTQNCGKCGQTCDVDNASQSKCSSGTCIALSCDPGYSLSNGQCIKSIDTTSDVKNCGKVGNVCSTKYNYGSSTNICVNSLCRPATCNTGYDWSGSACIPITSDLNNCGKCGNVCAFPHGKGSCASGFCTLTSCNPGYQMVDGQCVSMDITCDTNNCGKVGNKCLFTNGDGICQNSGCLYTSCTGNYKLVNNGCVAVNTDTDTSNCGGMGQACPASYQYGGKSVCTAGKCSTTCNSGYDFNVGTGNGANGYCQYVQDDANNCGKCGNKCITSNGQSSCVAGKCSISSCNGGFYNVNGVCTSLNLQTDPNNCGTVGTKCIANFAHGSGVQCTGGSCRPTTCVGLYDWDVTSKQCIPTDSDMNNCGACGAKCTIPNGLGQCSGGVCSIKSCSTGFQPVNGVCTSMNLVTDSDNCGRVGNKCVFTNGSGSCKNSLCTYTSCDSSNGYVLSGNTCSKVDTNSDPKNCGSVGNACQATYLNGGVGSCVNGHCTSQCKTLFDWDPFFSYCRDVSSDQNNCGKCGSTCSPPNAASAVCRSGTCYATSCKPSYQLISGVCTGIDTTCDVDNCGAVGHPCVFPAGATGICQKSTCVITACPTKYKLVDGACVINTASQRARLAKKDTAALDKRTLCPAGETACPILGSASYDLAVSHHFTAVNEFSGVMAGSGGYECLDVKQSLDSCGGCASTGEGQDCTKIRGAVGVGCDEGKCVVFSCLAGWRANIAGTKCVRAHTEHTAHNTTKTSAPRRHLQARHGHAHAHGHS